MATQATLNIDILANTFSLEKGLAGAGKGLNDLEEQTEKTGKKALTFQDRLNSLSGTLQSTAQKLSQFSHQGTGAIGGIIQSIAGSIPVFGTALAGVVGIMEGISSAMAATKRDASALGVSLQQLQALKFWSKGQFDSVQVALPRLLNTLGDAKTGSAEAQKKFQDLGIDWARLATSSPYDALKLVAEKVKDTGDQMEKTHIVTELFGRGAAELIPILNGGAEAFDVANRKAANFTEGLKAQMALAQGWRAWKEDVSSGFAITVTNPGKAFDILSDSASDALKSTSDLAGQMKTAAKSQEELAEQARAAARALEEQARAADEANAKALQLKTDLYTDQIRKEINAINDRTTAVLIGADAWKRAELFNKGDAEKIPWGELNKQMAELEKAQDKFNKFNLMKQTLEDIKSPMEHYMDQVAKLTTLWEEGFITLEQLDQAIEKQADKFLKLKEDKEKAEKPHDVGAVQKGSVDAANAVLKAQQSDQQRLNQLILMNQKLDQVNNNLADAPLFKALGL